MNLKTLAEKLGLSQTTVSRALNGYPEVSEATRLRVQDAAVRFNYRPNSRAKGLATGRSMVVAQIVPGSSEHEMVNPIFGDFVGGATEALARFGYDMMISRVLEDDEGKIYRELHARGAVDAVILQGPSVEDPRIPLLNEIGMPYIVHGRSTGITAPYSWVDVNNKRSFRRATQFLTDLGHRRIALINGLEYMDFAQRRRSGYQEALDAAGIAADPALMCSADMTEGYGYRETRRLLHLADPPTAILSASMLAAIGIRRAIQESGLTMGRDVSVITHDDDLSYLRNGDDIPIFTATRASVRAAGAILAEQLVALISAPESGPVHHMIEAELVVGGSTGPARRRT
ncbi:LacI family DNA-binding transcriptional regulator [Pseudooceanicola sediminis]|uniref:LacI family DNA-binding transcriptional regulator n=1 Tax=Pseudooceanicola sediminis TaxID=2211117 RepID=A0A399J7B4_9RHOB|nr:LacI family DNA-binding transcriptional regulator [Pseudooceanicola sediminis]KAA2315616.1 LacI family DNA-binding transcriptional regulator [Puniceibacterium sp. HSS470]RII40427.1 LacI family DNA-binding transcriptional regulator [Pseudooceanicola sediminis]